VREVFLLASLMYTDQFDDEKLWEFSLWLEYALGAVRLDKDLVRYQTAQNFVKQDLANPANLNLLDVISSSFSPEQVITHLKTRQMRPDIYATETVEAGKGVQGLYKQAVLAYFDQPELTSLRAKDAWIDAKLKGGLA
jgi:hypothetical protein